MTGPEPDPSDPPPPPARAKRARRLAAQLPVIGTGTSGAGAPELRNADPAAVLLASDLLRWIVGIAAKLPRSARFGLGTRIEAAATDVLEHLVTAQFAKGSRRYTALHEANLRLQVLRHLLRTLGELGLVSKRQQLYGVAQTIELGKQVGGWHKQSANTANSSANSATSAT